MSGVRVDHRGVRLDGGLGFDDGGLLNRRGGGINGGHLTFTAGLSVVTTACSSAHKRGRCDYSPKAIRHRSISSAKFGKDDRCDRSLHFPYRAMGVPKSIDGAEVARNGAVA
jgi:hypothetical protein